MKLGSRDKFYAFGSDVGRSLSRFILGVLVARFAGPEAYSTFVLLLTIEVIGHTLCNSIWVTPMMTIAPGLPSSDRGHLVRTAYRRHALASLLFGGLLLAGLGAAQSRGVSTSEYVGFCLTVTSVGILNAARARLLTAFRSRPMFWADLWSTLLPILAVAMAMESAAGVGNAFWWSRGIGGVLAVGGMMLAFAKLPRESGGQIPQRFRVMGRHMFVGSVANSACSRVQPFVLAAVNTPTGVGLFGAASALLGPMRMLTMALSGVLRPRLSLHFGQGREEKAWRIALLAAGLTAAAGVLATGFCVLFGEPIASLVYGAGFSELGLLLPWAAIYAGLASVNSILAVLIQTVDSAATTTRLRFVAGILSLALVWPGCSLFGPVGAFVSLVLAEAYYLAVGGGRMLRFRRPSYAPAA